MSLIDGWNDRRLSQLADYINGFAFKPEHWGKEGLPIIRIEQLKKPDSISDYYAGKLINKFNINNGDLIFSWSASLFLRIWQHGEAALNQHLFKVIEKDGVDKLFLKFFIEYYLPELKKASHGSTMQHITRKELDNFSRLFPLCKKEQDQIATILSTIDKAIEQTQAIIAKQQRIKTGLMQDLLTRGIDENGNIRSEDTHEFKDSPLGRIPIEWKVLSLKDVTEKITDGDHHTPQRSVSGIYLLSARNILNGQIRLTDVDFIPESEYKRMIKRCHPEAGDILLSCSGTIGRVCEVPKKLKCALVRSAALLKLNRELLTPRYAEWILRSESIQAQIIEGQKQAAQPNLFQGEIEIMKIVLPPIDEQEVISNILDAQENSVKKYYKNVAKKKRTKIALMQDLLTGKVRVTNLKPLPSN